MGIPDNEHYIRETDKMQTGAKFNVAVKANMSRVEVIQALRRHFLEGLAEDGIDGTVFDNDVLDMLATLERKYTSV